MIYITLNGDIGHTINIAYTVLTNEILAHIDINLTFQQFICRNSIMKNDCMAKIPKWPSYLYLSSFGLLNFQFY